MQVGLIGIIQIIFILVKLFGVVTWSWWVVLSPLLGSALLTITLFTIFGGIARKLYREL